MPHDCGQSAPARASRYSGGYCVVPLSRDPAKRERQLANLTSRPPAPPAGNTRNLRHGAHARQATLIAADAWEGRIYHELEAEAPLRGADGGLPPADRQAVELLAKCLARLQAVAGYLDLHGPLGEDGTPRPALDAEGRLRREAGEYLDRLGMTPRARAALGLDITRQRDLALEWAQETDGNG